jgi:hypothetical protein
MVAAPLEALEFEINSVVVPPMGLLCPLDES